MSLLPPSLELFQKFFRFGSATRPLLIHDYCAKKSQAIGVTQGVAPQQYTEKHTRLSGGSYK